MTATAPPEAGPPGHLEAQVRTSCVRTLGRQARVQSGAMGAMGVMMRQGPPPSSLRLYPLRRGRVAATAVACPHTCPGYSRVGTASCCFVCSHRVAAQCPPARRPVSGYVSTFQLDVVTGVVTKGQAQVVQDAPTNPTAVHGVPLLLLIWFKLGALPHCHWGPGTPQDSTAQ